MIKYRVDISYKSYNSKTISRIMEFNDTRHFENYYRKNMNGEKYKIVGYERIYDSDKNFSDKDMYNAFMAGRQTELLFGHWMMEYTKQKNYEQENLEQNDNK